MLRVAVALVVLVMPCVAFAKTWFVTSDGLGDAPTIQAGIDSAAAKDTVLVGCGDYFEHDIALKPAVTLRSETDDPDCARIDAQGLGRVLVAIGAAPLARIEGFTITGGQGLAGVLNGGGGIHCNSSELEIARCDFTGNHSSFGAGAGCYGSSVDFQECRFEDNAAGDPAWAAGGGIFFKTSLSEIHDCEFISNSAFSTVQPGDGGGIFSEASTVKVFDCLFEENSSGAGGGGMYSFAYDQPTITRCTFTNNVSGAGGGMYLETSSAILYDCLFSGNAAATGGAMMIAAWSFPEIEGCVFSANSAAPLSGGGISCWQSGPYIRDCKFLDNSAALDGGGMYCGGVSSAHLTGCSLLRNTAGNRGGAFRCFYTFRLDITECTIAENSAPGGAIVADHSGPTTLENSILALGPVGAAVVCLDESPVVLHCSDIFGNAGGDWLGCIASQAGQDGNFSADPLFCDLPANDCGLEANSPCAPENSGSCGVVGAFPVGCSAVSVDSAMRTESWGAIKALYR